MNTIKRPFVLILIITSLLSACKTDIKSTNTINTTEEKDVSSEKNDDQLLVTQKKKIKVDHYICYVNDSNPKLTIWVSYSKDEKAIQIKYKGQTAAIDLVFDKEEFMKGGAHPTIIKHYNEIYNDKVNGKYKLTHSGNWDYVEYIRGKDQKKFNFTIQHETSYVSKPCF